MSSKPTTHASIHKYQVCDPHEDILKTITHRVHYDYDMINHTHTVKAIRFTLMAAPSISSAKKYRSISEAGQLVFMVQSTAFCPRFFPLEYTSYFKDSFPTKKKLRVFLTSRPDFPIRMWEAWCQRTVAMSFIGLEVKLQISVTPSAYIRNRIDGTP